MGKNEKENIKLNKKARIKYALGEMPEMFIYRKKGGAKKQK